MPKIHLVKEFSIDKQLFDLRFLERHGTLCDLFFYFVYDLLERVIGFDEICIDTKGFYLFDVRFLLRLTAPLLA